MKRKKIGLVLGGGGAKGFAHIGVIKILEKNKIPIDYIAGTSMGALIGTLYLQCKNAKKLEKLAINTDIKELVHLTFLRIKTIDIKKVEKFLKKEIKLKKFNQLKIPLFITALNKTKNKERVFKKGDIFRALRASIAIPGLISPAKINKEEFIDGGWIEPLPIKTLEKSDADIIIAVNLLEKHYKKTTSENAHVTIEIKPHVEKIKEKDFEKIKSAIKKGEQETNRKLKEIKGLMK